MYKRSETKQNNILSIDVLYIDILQVFRLKICQFNGNNSLIVITYKFITIHIIELNILHGIQLSFVKT